MRPGTVSIAPGGRHLVLRAQGNRLLTGLNHQPAENHGRPSADVMFRSAAVGAKRRGRCGGAGRWTATDRWARPLKRAGAYADAQDEATSVVWGMPGNVVRAGLADELLPLGEIAAAVQSLVAAAGALTCNSHAPFSTAAAIDPPALRIAVGEDKTYLVQHRLGPWQGGPWLPLIRGLALQACGPEGARCTPRSSRRSLRPGLPSSATATRSMRFAITSCRNWGRKHAAGGRSDLRCAAATGQEPYSLALILCDYIQANSSRLPSAGRGMKEMSEGAFSLLATDISEKVLVVAGGNLQRAASPPALPSRPLARHFERRDGGVGCARVRQAGWSSSAVSTSRGLCLL